jgi:hypothetical protein
MRSSWALANANHRESRLFRGPFFCQLQDRGEQSNQYQCRAVSLRIKHNSQGVVAFASNAFSLRFLSMVSRSRFQPKRGGRALAEGFAADRHVDDLADWHSS